MFNFFRSIVFKAFSKLNYGTLEIIEKYKNPVAKKIFGNKNSYPLAATIEVHNPEFYKRAVFGGEIGFGESYVDKLWSSPDLEILMLLLTLNKDTLIRSYNILESFSPYALKNYLERLATTRNTIDNCRKQVSFSYDLGDDFYELTLGTTVLYSCAIWNKQTNTLDEAQKNKSEILATKLNVKPNHHVLDIGHGWGYMANYLKTTRNCNVTGISLSKNQVEYCKNKYPDINFIYEDYRQHQGQYDRIISVGMVEHVGIDYLPVYFKKISSLLKPGGRAVVQSITVRELNCPENNKKRTATFAFKYSMPNVVLPTSKLLCNEIYNTKEMQVLHLEDFGPHYARTSHHWRKNLLEHKEKIIAKYSEKLLRIYDYTWAFISAGFTNGTGGLVQIIIEKKPLDSNNDVFI